MSGPMFHEAVLMYHQAGWCTETHTWLVNLPRGKKQPPPRGTTGRHGIQLLRRELEHWYCTDDAAPNLGLWTPPGVVGLDVDPRHKGHVSLERAEREYGALPATTGSYSPRGDGGCIRLYRVDEGIEIKSPGDGVDIIRNAWRYAAVWPSRRDDFDMRQYAWSDGIPLLSDVPRLPAPWVEALGRPEAVRGPRVSLPDAEMFHGIDDWLDQHQGGSSPRLLDWQVAKFERNVGRPNVHHSAINPCFAAVLEASLGLYSGRDALHRMWAVFEDAGRRIGRSTPEDMWWTEFLRIWWLGICRVADPDEDDQREIDSVRQRLDLDVPEWLAGWIEKLRDEEQG